MTFEERCRLSEQCLPNAPYREMLIKLHTEMLKSLAQSAQQEPVALPFEDKSVISALSWAAGLIEQSYRACGGHNGADSWLMNYADKQGERIRQADHREWEKVNGRWQVKATPPPQRKPLDKEQCFAIIEDWKNSNGTPYKLIDMVEAAHGIKENT